MSARPELRPEDAPDRVPEDLEHTPQDIEELFADTEDVDDPTTDIPGLEPQGFLPPPDAPRGPTLQEPRSSEGDACGPNEADSDERHEATQDALNTWRDRAGARRAAYARAELEAERRRGLLLRGVLTSTMLGLFVAWGITEIILNTDATPAAVDATPMAVVPTPATADASDTPKVSEANFEIAQASLVSPTVAPKVAPEPVQSSFDVALVDGRFKTWRLDDHTWWQFDFNGEEPLHLRWIAPDGNVKLEGWICDNRVTAAVGRCYVGQHLAHFAPEPGLWSLYACQDDQASACALVDEFTIEDGLTVDF